MIQECSVWSKHSFFRGPCSLKPDIPLQFVSLSCQHVHLLLFLRGKKLTFFPSFRNPSKKQIRCKSKGNMGQLPRNCKTWSWRCFTLMPGFLSSVQPRIIVNHTGSNTSKWAGCSQTPFRRRAWGSTHVGTVILSSWADCDHGRGHWDSFTSEVGTIISFVVIDLMSLCPGCVLSTKKIANQWLSHPHKYTHLGIPSPQQLADRLLPIDRIPMLLCINGSPDSNQTETPGQDAAWIS